MRYRRWIAVLVPSLLSIGIGDGAEATSPPGGLPTEATAPATPTAVPGPPPARAAEAPHARTAEANVVARTGPTWRVSITGSWVERFDRPGSIPTVTEFGAPGGFVDGTLDEVRLRPTYMVGAALRHQSGSDSFIDACGLLTGSQEHEQLAGGADGAPVNGDIGRATQRNASDLRSLRADYGRSCAGGEWRVGPAWYRIDESYRISVEGFGLPRFDQYTVTVGNDLYGGTIGGCVWLGLTERLRLVGDLAAGIYADHVRYHSELRPQQAGADLRNDTQHRTGASASADVFVAVAARLDHGLEAWVGYDLLAFAGVYRADDQVDFSDGGHRSPQIRRSMVYGGPVGAVAWSF